MGAADGAAADLRRSRTGPAGRPCPPAQGHSHWGHVTAPPPPAVQWQWRAGRRPSLAHTGPRCSSGPCRGILQLAVRRRRPDLTRPQWNVGGAACSRSQVANFPKFQLEMQPLMDPGGDGAFRAMTRLKTNKCPMVPPPPRKKRSAGSLVNIKRLFFTPVL